jgi:hypothetical protein
MNSLDDAPEMCHCLDMREDHKNGMGRCLIRFWDDVLEQECQCECEQYEQSGK